MERIRLAWQALQAWTARRWLIALVAAVITAVLLDWVTVLIPNPVFGGEIAPTAWSYPVWIVTAVLSGMLIATYVTGQGERPPQQEPTDRGSTWGTIGAIGSWFAIGCPVCNKLALLAPGYSGALTWFAPAQPFLAAVSLVLLAVGLVYRLAGTVACPVPQRAPAC